MVLDRTDAAAIRDADDDRQRKLPHGARPVFREVRRDLFECGVREPVELHLAHGLESVDRKPDTRSDDPRLGERRVDDALFTEFLLQLVGDAEHPAGLPHVFAHDDDAIVALHAIAQGFVQTLRERDRRHYWPS